MVPRRNVIHRGLLFVAVACSYYLEEIYADASLRYHGTQNDRTNQGLKSYPIHQNRDILTMESENNMDRNADLGRKLPMEGDDVDVDIDADVDVEVDVDLDEDLEENEIEALIRHDMPPEERDVIGDSIFLGPNNVFVQPPEDTDENTTDPLLRVYPEYSEEIVSGKCFSLNRNTLCPQHVISLFFMVSHRTIIKAGRIGEVDSAVC